MIYFNEETSIKLTEPYDKENPDKELTTITVDAKTLYMALKNRNKSEAIKENGTKERITNRAVSASNSNNLNNNEHDINKDINI